MTESELDRLEQLLDSDLFQGEGPLLDELQAMLCAIVSGPAVVMPNEWLPAVFGEHPAYESQAQAEEVITLVLRFYDDIAATLSEGKGISLILYPVSEEARNSTSRHGPTPICTAARSVPRTGTKLPASMREDLSELIEPFFLLTGKLKEDAQAQGERWLSAAQEQRALAHAREDLPELVTALHQFWQVKGTPVQSYQRESPKVGRNDPCPCGSGRKYKQCCGSPEKLH
ncbi:MAG: UPF0149 family protein [Comamonadaceae bacterium]|nr:UPF0149 family protein [Comamonadaceae bacterium]